MSNIFDCLTEELSITGHPESMEILWNDIDYLVIRDGYWDRNILCASLNRETDEVTFYEMQCGLLRLTDEQKAEMARRLVKYKDRIIEMHLKHESLRVPVRRVE